MVQEKGSSEERRSKSTVLHTLHVPAVRCLPERKKSSVIRFIGSDICCDSKISYSYCPLTSLQA